MRVISEPAPVEPKDRRREFQAKKYEMQSERYANATLMITLKPSEGVDISVEAVLVYR